MTSSARPLLERGLAESGTAVFAEMSALAVRTGGHRNQGEEPT
jgi:N-succinyldiaminopimelate aminotransferase